MASGTSGRGGWPAHERPHARWLDYAWLFPAVLGATATALLAWSAWLTARDLAWPARPAWWWTMLRPDMDGTLLATSALWLASLASYWWPRRFQRQPIALITIVAMVIIGGALTTASLVPCRGSASHAVVLGWLLSLYLGNQPALFSGSGAGPACPGYPPLGMQLGEIFCPGATVVGLLGVGAVLWREPVGRLRSRFASDATVFTGLDPLTLPLLRRLANGARSPRDIIVIEQDEDHALLDEARLTGARVIIGDPASPRLLQPIISAARGCALSQLYAVGSRVQENEKVVAAAARILRRYRADTEHRPHLVALVDDPRHADAWRGNHGGSPGIWFEDALSSAESTACGLVGRVLATGARELMLCGDSSLTLAILLELARRAWELAELGAAAAIGRDAIAAAAASGQSPVPLVPPSPMPVQRVLLIDPQAEDMLREYLATVPQTALRSGPDVVRRVDHWHDYLLRALDAKDGATARQTAVVIVDSRPESGLHAGGRVARLHPGTPVFVLAPPGEGISRPIFGRLMPFERELLVDGDLPEDTWQRIARHWHEYHRLSRPVESGDPKAANRLPWADLDPAIRTDNIHQLRSILTQVAECGRQWAPVRLVPPGSFIELSDTELETIAMAEHDRWYRRRQREGWSADAPPPGKPARRRTNKLLVPWGDLPAQERAESKERVRTQLKHLEDVGFMPVLPAGGPPAAASFERIGIVAARRLTTRLRWTLPSGEEMHGNPGDWRVVDSTGSTGSTNGTNGTDSMRTVTDSEFQSSHEPLRDGRWRRTGTFRAWPVTETVVVRTKEGNATARAGDWVVEGPGGERWPVSDGQFQASYRARPDRAARAGHASMAVAISSTTAPTISS